jgi:hypothetical protein
MKNSNRKDRKLQLNRLPDESVHEAGFGREDLGVLEFNEVTLSESATAEFS